jgi:electron transport complex protein RnfE
MSLKKLFMDGILDENPTFKLVLGMCPTLAVTTQAINGIGMGLATTFVMIFSNLTISLLRKQIPEKIRIPVFVIIIATFATLVDLMMQAYTPALYEALGIFIPLIVVNCLLFARAESMAFKNTALPSLIDALGMGLGYTLGLTLLAAVREMIGSGSIFGVMLFGPAFEPAIMFVMAPGGFITLGILMGLLNHLQKKFEARGGKRA